METSSLLVSSLVRFNHHSLLPHHRPHKFTELEASCESSLNIEADDSLWASGEASFQIDDLLDLPDEEESRSPSTIVHAEEEIPASASSHTRAVEISTERPCREGSSITGHEPESGLCVPPDELVSQLEWLSAFNDDTFFSGETKLLALSPHPKTTPVGPPSRFQEPYHNVVKGRDKFHSQSPVSVLERSADTYTLRHLHKSSRVRKVRRGGRVWSLDILKPIPTGSRLKVQTGNTGLLATTTCASSFMEDLYMSFQHEAMERPFKKAKKNGSSLCAMESALVRRCSHCFVQKTPQWRAGPLGPKTLCNACGVRYKSGRLVPEYRPAASPTFVNEVHSNSHRRILEMRRVKEIRSNRHVLDGGLPPIGYGRSRALKACEENPRDAQPMQVGLPLDERGIDDLHSHDDQCKMCDNHDDSSLQGSSSSCKPDGNAACRDLYGNKEALEQDAVSPRQPNSKEGQASNAMEGLGRVSFDDMYGNKEALVQDAVSPRQLNSKEGQATIAMEGVGGVSFEDDKASKKT